MGFYHYTGSRFPLCPHTITSHWNVSISELVTFSKSFYKITKIVRALWLAERSVSMRVCKHGCGVKMFCFSRANHASTNLKKFSSSKLDRFTLFAHSFVGWNLENRYKEGVSIFFRLSRHFKREKSVFWKASFCKTRTDYACMTSWTRLCEIYLLVSAMQRVLRFFSESYFIKAMENVFPVFA